MKSGYLSFSDSKWRVIYQGLPVCKDMPTRTEAEHAAAKLKVPLQPEHWDGNQGIFLTQG